MYQVILRVARNSVVASLLMCANTGLPADLSIARPAQRQESHSPNGLSRKDRKTSLDVSLPNSSATQSHSGFTHSIQGHQLSCGECHLVPTASWATIKGYPDIADYPSHEACTRCHRSAFRDSVQMICVICHVNRVSGVRRGVRLAFPNPTRPREFRIEFRHDRHLDVLSQRKRTDPKNRNALFLKAAFVPSGREHESRYWACEICHTTAQGQEIDLDLDMPLGGWPTLSIRDGFTPKPNFFKTSPTDHAACFSCHFKGQEPTAERCSGCHQASKPSYKASSYLLLKQVLPKRISMKFSHDGGGDHKNHPAECTTCHINITKATTLQGLKPDVPIAPGCAASSCHQPELAYELSRYNKAPGSFTCVKCHTSDVGGKRPPNSHLLAALGA
jgi:hypothetical protein